jgi:tetratricopeptide (TPR) repeat protein
VAGGGPGDLLRRVRQVREDLTLVDALERIRLQKATIVEGMYDDTSADRAYAALFRERGLAVEGEDVVVVAARIEGSAVRAQLVAALDAWAAAASPGRRAWLLEVARRAEPGTWGDRFRDPAVWGKPAALEQLAREANVAELSPQLLTALGQALLLSEADAVPLLMAAQQRHPGDFWLNVLLGSALAESKRGEEAVGYYRAALAVRPDTAAVYNGLGIALRVQGRLDDAIQQFRRAIALDPTLALAYNNLGVALQDQGRLDDAIQAYRRAIALDPTLALAHINLGRALKARGRPDDAIHAYRQALALGPKFAGAHYNLGNALRDQGRLDNAIQAYRRALALDPKYALAYNNLGVALEDQGRLDDAIQAYRRAIALDPKYAVAHYNLGGALRAQGRLGDAIQAFRQAITLDPKDPGAHNNLGGALQDQGRLDDAIQQFRRTIDLDPTSALAHISLGGALARKGRPNDAIHEYRRAIALDPKHALAHYYLGLALKGKGLLGDAIQAYHRCLELLSPNDPMRQTVTQQLQQCQRFLELSKRLPAILEGQAQPSGTAERLALAQLCQHSQQHYTASARFYAEAFTQQPQLADDLRSGHRYYAACAAALAAAGRGIDAASLDDQERARLRRQAVGWLQADLTAWAKLLQAGPPDTPALVLETLAHWQGDLDLASLRDPAAVANLPSGERQACRKLWADVEALLQRAQGKAP